VFAEKLVFAEGISSYRSLHRCKRGVCCKIFVVINLLKSILETSISKSLAFCLTRHIRHILKINYLYKAFRNRNIVYLCTPKIGNIIELIIFKPSRK